MIEIVDIFFLSNPDMGDNKRVEVVSTVTKKIDIESIFRNSCTYICIWVQKVFVKGNNLYMTMIEFKNYSKFELLVNFVGLINYICM